MAIGSCQELEPFVPPGNRKCTLDQTRTADGYLLLLTALLHEAVYVYRKRALRNSLMKHDCMYFTDVVLVVAAGTR